MAAIASTAVSQYPTDRSQDLYVGGTRPRELVMRSLKITGVTAADTATAAVLGFQRVIAAHGAVYGTGFAPCLVGVDPVNNKILIGAGASNETVYLTVVGTPA